MENPKDQQPVGGFNLPEWETTARHRGEKQTAVRNASFKDRVAAHFDRTMPSHRRYFGLSRKYACIVIAAVIVAILILIIGLAVGLSDRSSNHKPLPLGSQTYTGDLTYYGPGLGACGVTSSDSDNIVSVSHFIFDAVSKGSNPNANPLCRLKIRALRDGKSVDLTVVDRCVGCKTSDLDVSPGAFKQLADPALGRVTMTWAWLSPVPSP